MNRSVCAIVLALFCVAVGVVRAQDADPFQWLEDKDGARAMAWVREHNAKSLPVLQGDPHYAPFYDAAVAIVESKDRIPLPAQIGGDVYNFWRDGTHVRGIWRRTTPGDYAKSAPTWSTVLDLDAVAAAEKANWVWRGAQCEPRVERRCLLELSDGGEDADTVREFDLATRSFVQSGFVLPKGKQNVAWAGANALLVAREWAPGELTTSGYPYIVKRLERGKPLSAAVEIFRGKATDVSVDPIHFLDGDENEATLVERNPTFFTSEYEVVNASGVRKLELPQKSDVVGLVAGRLLIELREDWSVGGTTFPQGALVAVDLGAAKADPAHPRPTLVYAPGPRESLGAVRVTKSALMFVLYENVRGRAFVYRPRSGGWDRQRLNLPDNSTIDLVSTSRASDTFFLTVRSFLTPTTLYAGNASSLEVAVEKALPPQFDGSRDTVDQFEATSRDGTRIPYFVVHPKSMTLDGSNPTVINAYGGFQVSETPFYSGVIGKLWLERGGVFVLANIRGGGEFGPAWHDAGLKTHRQRIYDDFYAVGADLINRKITSPRRLGIMGGSNGGLLMGVEFVQHPDMWNAVDIQVPLLDMLRYEKIQAGASWVAEYGRVSVPEERAFLASISPYNNLKAGVTYPVPFVWTTTKDDRVGPQHARKFAARLESLGDPYLFYEVTEGGHGAGANLREQAQTSALEWTYFTMKLMSGA